MTTFFVGQRVRIIRRSLNKGLIGREATVISPLIQAVSTVTNTLVLVHYLDIDDIGMFNKCGNRFSAKPADIEPILPSGHTAGHEGVCEELDRLLSGVVA